VRVLNPLSSVRFTITRLRSPLSTTVTLRALPLPRLKYLPGSALRTPGKVEDYARGLVDLVSDRLRCIAVKAEA
jgi:hypothetical protein